MSTFYNKFKEEELKKEKELNIETEPDIILQTQPIIMENKSTFKSLVRFLISVFLFCIKSVFYIGTTILSSIGLTVLINQSLRDTFFEFIKTVI